MLSWVGSGFRVAAVTALALTMAVAGSISSAAAANVDRLVLALEVPPSESNRFWEGGHWTYLGPSLQMLIGNHAVTGQYTNSELAESWEHNEDFTQWTFHLKRGVEFHFGHGEMTAADVLHSYELVVSPESRLQTAGLMRGATVTAPDDYTVVFEFDEPRTDFEFNHAGRGDLFIYSKAQFEKEGMEGYDERFAGTGPWQVLEKAPGRMVFERVENHWSGYSPEFKELEMRFVAEPSTRLAMLLSGEAHIAVLPRELYPAATDAGMRIFATQNASMQTVLHFNGLFCTTGDLACGDHLPWSDIRVREAMARALNREEMLQVLFDGRARLLPWYGMRAGNEGYDSTIAERVEAKYGYDPERARQLLEEAGYPDAFEDPVIPIVDVAMSGQPELATQAVLIQQYFEAVGFQTRIVKTDMAALRAAGRGRTEETYVISPSRNSPIRPTDAHFSLVWRKDGSVFENFEDDQTVEYQRRLATTMDPAERDRIAREAFHYLVDNYALIPLFEVYAEAVYNPEVVRDWTYPGSTTTGYGHWHFIKSAF